MKQGQLCVICGIRLAKTMDHLPPKALYPKPLPKQMHTVPACQECNGGHSVADEDFKVFILADTSLESPERAKVVKHVARTVKHNPNIKKRVGASQEVTVRLRSGAIEKARAFRYQAHFYVATMKRIVRGFYWRETGKVLNAAARIEIYQGRKIHPELRESIQALLNGVVPSFCNDETLGYRWTESEDGLIFWELCFFKQHLTYAVVDCPPSRD